MKRPTEINGPAWSAYEDEITAAAAANHGLDLWWNYGDANVTISEDGTSNLGFHSCEPRWVATWSLNTPAPVIADADPLLLTVADGPNLQADAHEVGRWISHVIATIAGHRPATDVDQIRDFGTDGYTTFPNQ